MLAAGPPSPQHQNPYQPNSPPPRRPPARDAPHYTAVPRPPHQRPDPPCPPRPPSAPPWPSPSPPQPSDSRLSSPPWLSSIVLFFLLWANNPLSWVCRSSPCTWGASRRRGCNWGRCLVRIFRGSAGVCSIWSSLLLTIVCSRGGCISTASILFCLWRGAHGLCASPGGLCWGCSPTSFSSPGNTGRIAWCRGSVGCSSFSGCCSFVGSAHLGIVILFSINARSPVRSCTVFRWICTWRVIRVLGWAIFIIIRRV